MLSLFTIMRRTPRATGLRTGEVMLTFDDGPNLQDDVTPRLLDVLHRRDVKAGFCLVGRQVQRHPAIVRRIWYSGHLLINHTQNHIHPLRQSLRDVLLEIDACDVELSEALGLRTYRSEHFRAPFGIVTPAVRRAVKARNMTQVLLSHYAWDTRVGPHNCGTVVQKLIDNARRQRGGLFVFHDGGLKNSDPASGDWSESCDNRSWIPDAVDEVITALKSDGLRFVIPTGDDQRRLRATTGRAA